MTEKNRIFVELKYRETQFCIWRLTDEEYQQLRDNSLPIKEDSRFFLHLALSEHYNPERLTLPKAFLTLEHLFGKTSHQFDDWKGTFSFPLLLEVRKDAGCFFYLWRIYDHRGSLYFPLYRVLENGANGYNVNAYRDPFELEFSREEINQFISYFYGYLIGVSKWIYRFSTRTFLKKIDSENIIYGYKDGEFFERQFDSEEEYEKEIRLFEETYETTVMEEKSGDVKSLLQKIVNKAL